MKTHTYIEIEVEVDFDFQPEERMTRDYPGCPAHIELNDIILPSKDQIIKDNEDLINEACWDEVKEEQDYNDLMTKARRMLK